MWLKTPEFKPNSISVSFFQIKLKQSYLEEASNLFNNHCRGTTATIAYRCQPY